MLMVCAHVHDEVFRECRVVVVRSDLQHVVCYVFQVAISLYHLR